MSKCIVSGDQFINFVFSPRIGLLVSPDVEEICQKDNLSFDELLRPFCHVTRDVTIRDSSNLVHTIRNLHLKFLNVMCTPLPRRIVSSKLKSIVSVCSTDNSLKTYKISDEMRSISVPISLPWFEAWRYIFITNLWPYEHEFLGHIIGCVFVLSTAHENPVQGFTELTQNQSNQQHCHPGSYPLWFTENILKFYVLLHDASQMSLVRAEEIFNQVKITFGSQNCYMLSIFTVESIDSLSNERTANVTSTKKLISGDILVTNNYQDECEMQTDPWLLHLLPHGFKLPTTESNHLNVDNHTFMTKDLLNNVNDTANYVNSDVSEGFEAKYETSKFAGVDNEALFPSRYLQPHGQHLTQADRERIRMFVYDFTVRALLPWVEKTLRSLNDQIAHRMRLSRSFFSVTKKLWTQAVGGASPSIPTSTAVGSPSAMQTSIATSTSTSLLPPNNSTESNQPNGLVSTGHESDVKLSSASPVVVGSSAQPHVVYNSDAPELQMRRLADLAFLFQQYELAYQTYNVLKRDFQNDAAWLHFAGAQEMCALSVYLQGSTSQRQYPSHHMDTAITTYLQPCQAPELALRATFLNVEALYSRNLYNEASMNLLRLTPEEDDLTKGLLTEQMAYCLLKLSHPKLRKFAFHMALAAHHFNRAKQSYLAILCYKLVAPIIVGQGWSLLEDHINYNIGKQSYIIGDLVSSSQAYRKTLCHSSRQSAERQSLYVKEYLSVFVLLTKQSNSDGTNPLPEFPLPLVHLRAVKLMVGKPSQQKQDASETKTNPTQDLFIEARGIQFSDDDVDDGEESKPDVPTFRSNSNTQEEVGESIPDWFEFTDVDDGSSSDESCGVLLPSSQGRWLMRSNGQLSFLLERMLVKAAGHKYDGLSKVVLTNKMSGSQLPTIPVGEYLSIQLPLFNPTHIPLVFSNIHLLWSFVPQCHLSPGEQHVDSGAITNEIELSNTSGVSQSVVDRRHELCKQCVANQILSEFIMLPGERKMLQLSVSARQKGDLSITGVGLHWSHVSFTQTYAKSSSSAIPTDAKSRTKVQPSLNGESSLLVKGKLDLMKVQGSLPLRWKVTEPAPGLKVCFSSFPNYIYEGQLHILHLSLTNIGMEPLDNVRLASNWPGLLSFGSKNIECSKSSDSWLRVPLTDSVANPEVGLLPNATYVQPLWLRCPHLLASQWRSRRKPTSRRGNVGFTATNPDLIPSIQQKTVHLCFQYETNNPVGNSSTRCRFVRHRWEFEVRPSLQIEAVANARNFSAHQHLTIHMRVHNVTSPTVNTGFELKQVTCLSKYWQIFSLPFHQTSNWCVNSNEWIDLYFKAQPIDDGATERGGGEERHISTIYLNDVGQQQQELIGPQFDFFHRSGIKYFRLGNKRAKHKESQRTSTTQALDINLIIGWKILDESTDQLMNFVSSSQYGSSNPKWGQSHVTLNCLDRQVKMPLTTWSKSIQQKSDTTISTISTNIPDLVHTALLSKIIRLKLIHPKSTRCKFPVFQCPVPNASMLCTTTDMQLPPKVDSQVAKKSNPESTTDKSNLLTQAHSTSNTGPFGSVSKKTKSCPPIPPLVWIGLSPVECLLQSGEVKTIGLTGFIPCPGVYDASAFRIEACPMIASNAEFIPQVIDDPRTSSIIIVQSEC